MRAGGGVRPTSHLRVDEEPVEVCLLWGGLVGAVTLPEPMLKVSSSSSPL